MSEVFNFSPEFVSKSELEILAEWYTEQIKNADMKIAAAGSGASYKLARKEKFTLMQRRYYLRICIRNRTSQN